MTRPSDTREIAFEDAIEMALTEQISRLSVLAPMPTQVGEMRTGSSFALGQTATSASNIPITPPFRHAPNTGFDESLAFAPDELFAFLQASQPKEYARLCQDPRGREQLTERLYKKIKQQGLLATLRGGLQHLDFDFTLFYVYPSAANGIEVGRNFQHNRWTLMRQVHFDPLAPGQSVDVVILLNGLPLATLELKVSNKGQTARRQGIQQYKDRDPKALLMAYGHCLVHFTLDTDEVWMTTKLAGRDTTFLPFNKGNNDRAGNPPNPDGHRTAYLWQDVLQPRSLAHLVSHFIFEQEKTDEKTGRKTKTLIFPRYHQRDIVRLAIEDAALKGTGQTYLVQHSAGSGKSNSIMWLAYRLIEVYPVGDAQRDLPSFEKPVFDAVIVVTDRRLLDQQIRETIKSAEQVKGIVGHSDNSAKLREYMEGDRKIIITTIQMFPFIVDQIADLSARTFAILIDEAHSSQSGRAHDNMNAALGGSSGGGSTEKEDADEDSEDTQDYLLAAIRSRKLGTNASYFAFTATPKPITLEKFGIRDADGKYRPFHLYSMRQAIEEGFILDVLANYTTYRSYYEVTKSIEDNPAFEIKSAQKRLRRHVEEHPETIAAKAEIMVDHFIEQVVKPKRLKGHGRCMIVTKNIVAAIRYYQAVREVLRKRNHKIEALVAFSGKKMIDGIEHTERGLNGADVKDIREAFDTDPYRILVVANKFLTGFDQPKLCAMYVDKPLAGVQAVQTLSRLNRAAPKYNKRTEDLFVLDFFNRVEDIQTAFQDYYTDTLLTGGTDLNVLHDLIDFLRPVGVFTMPEVTAFAKTYFRGADAQDLSIYLDRAEERFSNGLKLDDKDQKDFKIKAKQFVKLYGQLASITPYEVPVWEELYWYLKFLIPKLRVESQNDELDDLLESVDLNTYGLERSRVSAKIELDPDAGALDPANSNPRSVHDDGDRDALDNIIATFNETHFSDWSATDEEKRARLISITERFTSDPRFVAQYQATTDPSNRERLKADMLEEAVQGSRDESLDFYRLWATDSAFRSTFTQVFDKVIAGRRGELPL